MLFVFSPWFTTFGALKRTVFISLLCFKILSITGLHELIRLPVLIQHYFEHKDIDSGITFIAYLEHHYNDSPHTDDDEERDKQLPFMATEFFSGSLVSSFLPPSFTLVPKKAYQILSRTKMVANNQHIPALTFAGKIWQPPKNILS